jgi:hypothetical protein
MQYEAAHATAATSIRGPGSNQSPAIPGGAITDAGEAPPPEPSTGATPKVHAFIGTAEVSAATAKMRLVQIAEEIIGVPASDPQGTVKVRVEINAVFPDGVSDQIKRAVSENAISLSFKNKTWE